MTTHNRGNNVGGQSTPRPIVTGLNGGTDADGRTWLRPRVRFTTTGTDPRTFTMFMVDPDVRIYELTAGGPWVAVVPGGAVEWNPGTLEPGARLRGQIIPATFEAWPRGTDDGPVIRFTLSWIAPTAAEGTAGARLGIESLTLGPSLSAMSARDLIRAAGGPHYFGIIEVTKNELERVPMKLLTDNALAMVRVFGDVGKVYKRRPRPGEHVTNDGVAFTVPVVKLETGTDAPKLPRGRKRGPTAALHGRVWHHREVLAIAARCKLAGMTRKQTAAHFEHEHGELWSVNSVKKMWAKCRALGLLETTTTTKARGNT